MGKVISTPVAKAQDKDMVIAGNAWINSCKDGKIRINILFNKGFRAEVDENDSFMLVSNPNMKREGKKDPDYMVSYVSPKA